MWCKKRYCIIDKKGNLVSFMDYKLDELDKLLDREIPLLIPAEILEDYNEAADENQRSKNRATSLRRCLEGSIELFYSKKMIPDYISKNEWDKLDLYRHITLIGEHIDRDIASKFHKIRKIGNDGAHFDSNVNSSDVNNLIIVINEIVEDLLVKYFELYNFGSQKEVLTLFSSLPPVCRIKILEKVKSNEYYADHVVLVDKLAMAYLKNNEFEKSILFLQNSRDEKIIDEYEYNDLFGKMHILQDSFGNLAISKNIIDTSQTFEVLTKIGIGKGYEEFMHIFSVLVDGYNVKHYG